MNEAGTPIQGLDAFKREFLLEYFRRMREEIDLRTRMHSQYVTAKIVACGALLSFLLTTQLKDEVRLLGLPLVPVVAMLYDVMIARNIGVTHKLGVFIRDQLEPLVPEVVLWEKYWGQKSPRARGYGLPDVLLLSLFTVGTILVSLVFYWRQGKIVPMVLVAAALVASESFTIVILYRWILHFDPLGKAQEMPQGNLGDAVSDSQASSRN
jgi:hypothetical protein